ncbi:hypothetical protein Patl1_21729 [Pistacia atlantica]|uniref:Uncharacterized protein n=1 Tax=Pistacia atlantica TaxID=434234 RepID=A0ACC1BLR1_9ROSI|nr:hypothetical protein Patl1_21729 [Pistacia atlantica]
MENTWRKYLHAKIHPILALFCLSSFVHHLVLAVPDQSRYPYQPKEIIIIAYGWSVNFISQDMLIHGDNGYQQLPLFELQNNASIASTAPQQPRSSSEKYFLKARLSYSPFTYIFNLAAGQKFIRLYFYPTSSGAIIVNTSIDVHFSGIPNYTAPVEVYKTAMSMGASEEINVDYWLTWEFPVDSGFTYFIRLHFCEFQSEITEHAHRIFQIKIANQTAETEADNLEWSNGIKGVPQYRDYAVIIGRKGNEKKQNLSVALHPAAWWMTNYSDAILNGVEIFKVDSYGNLAGPS